METHISSLSLAARPPVEIFRDQANFNTKLHFFSTQYNNAHMPTPWISSPARRTHLSDSTMLRVQNLVERPPPNSPTTPKSKAVRATSRDARSSPESRPAHVQGCSIQPLREPFLRVFPAASPSHVSTKWQKGQIHLMTTRFPSRT